MADNIYLLETRLSKGQQAALAAVREVAKERSLTVFLVGGAVRDLIGGTAVRDLDVAVQGNALKLRKDIEKRGGVITGETEAGQALFLRFPGGVRVEIGSTLTVAYPKPGKAVVKPATILEDLRRRDFTANAMALSLNEGSYGLLMDPLNGVADIENRELRLVSNYGFIEDPARMIRAARFAARLGWHMDEKTQARYETGKAEGYISAMDDFHRGYETEEIFHEEDALRVIRRLEEEGWIQHLVPSLSAAKANVGELDKLRESQAQLQIQGIAADAAAASFPSLTSKMATKDLESLKKSFPRPGFVAEIEGLEAKGKEFAAQLGGKGAALPSQSYKLITSADPEAVLWVAYTTKSPGLQAKFKSFYTDWQQARQRVPYLQMQEMRITPDLPDYELLVERLFFELMDGRLTSPEEIKAFLEPYSPPAPPPPVSLRRPRAAKKDAKSRKKAAETVAGETTEGAPESENESAMAGPAIKDEALEMAPTPAKSSDGSATSTKASTAKSTNGRPAVKAQVGSPKRPEGPAEPTRAPAEPVKSATGRKPERSAEMTGKKAPMKSASASAPKKLAATAGSPKKPVAVKKPAPVKKAAPAKKASVTKASAKKPVAAKKGGAGKAVGKTAPGKGGKVAPKKTPAKAPGKKVAAKAAPAKKRR